MHIQGLEEGSLLQLILSSGHMLDSAEAGL
jgi:hypothetical protein